MQETPPPIGAPASLPALAQGVATLHRRTCGRAPDTTLVALDDGVVAIVLRGVLTRLEVTLVEGGRAPLVVAERHALHRVLARTLSGLASMGTGLRPASVLDAADPRADVVVFVLLTDDGRPHVRYTPLVSEVLDPESGRSAPALEIANRIAALHKRATGKGPSSTRVHQFEDAVVVVLRGGLTRLEHTLADEGREDRVLAQRHALQESLREEYVATVETLTGREVEAFLSANHTDPDAQVEVFVLRPV
ncbi:Na-translocating system protein MpsC family protein [Patulibacter brassicae]|uniref:Na-translocating system protein MpsC family protein n=1 Tax=Patulibacter brassicae TaxID=1705717 RepID=A0ABU4VN19_9ACTN|nr:Na-translocating system protein MpsC family protein [Patulibacter brassicae]MDX8153234.1 Na-translocating system protein MpsC family protein [Patulibacter brassicae]